MRLYEDDVDLNENTPALLVDDDGSVRLNPQADDNVEVMLVQGDLVDGWEAPRTGVYTVGHIRWLMQVDQRLMGDLRPRKRLWMD